MGKIKAYKKMKQLQEEKRSEQTQEQVHLNSSNGMGVSDMEQSMEIDGNPTLAPEANNSSKAKALSRQQKRLVNELRRLNANIISADAIKSDGNKPLNVHDKLNANRTKSEKDFSSTLVICDNKMVLINDLQGKKRRCTMRPKKYADFLGPRIEGIREV
ncbi:uncharacterized protein LOC110177809 [Drosophila serrata]|uniref:uncharacterized protein LOC110177809 n=1 Tax=Drosophila serrata TaxID=7274 RepID=UPI000A1D054D|nr:uncharacterized protein LOC110177809 [Drosophila serrata]